MTLLYLVNLGLGASGVADVVVVGPDTILGHRAGPIVTNALRSGPILSGAGDRSGPILPGTAHRIGPVTPGDAERRGPIGPGTGRRSS